MAQTVLSVVRAPLGNALPQRRRGRFVESSGWMRSSQPREAPREGTRGQPEHFVQLLTEVDGAGLDVPVIQDVEGDAQECGQAAFLLPSAEAAAPCRACPGEGSVTSTVWALRPRLNAVRDANARHYLSLDW